MSTASSFASAFSSVLGSVGACAAALLLSPALTPRAHAFGGAWSSQDTPIEASAARILFVDDPGPTVTAIIDLRYAGPAQSFVWLIPVPSTPTVALSSSVVLDRLEAATAPEYWLEVGHDDECEPAEPAPPAEPASAVRAAPIEPIARGSDVDFEYATLAVDPSLDDPAEPVLAWLREQGYSVGDVDGELLGSYLRDGQQLLALQLRSAADSGSIRPIRLTYETDQPTIPLRALALAAGEDVPLRVWMLGAAQAVPDNYASLVPNDALIDWLSGFTFAAGTLPAGGVGPTGGPVPAPSNYDAVVRAATEQAGGRGFVTELGGPASQFRQHLWSSLDDETFATFMGESYDDGLQAVQAAHALYGAWDGFRDALGSAATLPDGVSLDELARDPLAHGAGVEVDTAAFLTALEQRVIRPVADSAELFQRAPYLTRLYTRMNARDMTLDPALAFNAELAQVGNVHVAHQRIECARDQAPDDAPWTIQLPQGGLVVGEGGEGWPWDAGSLPANLLVVMLGTRGSGTVLIDHSEAIGRALAEAAGGLLAEPTLPPPEHGLTIGGVQSVKLAREPHSIPAERHVVERSSSCSAAPASSSTNAALAGWCVLAGVLLARRRRATLIAAALASLVACTDAADPAGEDAGPALLPGALTREELRDPEQCKDCHPTHYVEWSSSMHAYAAKDPVFQAMNRRGQRETEGALGDFCVRCHAPMAVIDGLTRDGLNLHELPDLERGVSCYFCHNVVDIEGDHNALLRVADDTTMRGPIADPFPTAAHGTELSGLVDGNDPRGSAMCGACHDIVTPTGVHLERTFEEYRAGLFSKSSDGQPPAFDSCSGCHMPPRPGLAAVAPEGVQTRTLHEHVWPGIDVALTDFPYREAMASAVEDCQLGLAVSFFTLEVTPPDLFTFQLETTAGHNTPSGAAHDRRMWLELLTYDAEGRLIEELSSGNIADDEPEEYPEDDPRHDPQLFMLRDRIYDADGKPVHMFWEAARSAAHPEGYESTTLPVSRTTYIDGKHAVIKQYRLSGPDGLPARVTARLRMRPMGLDVLQDLVDSGDLDERIMAEMPTFTLGAQLEWTTADGFQKTLAADPAPTDCATYPCMIDPSAPNCD